VKSSQGRLQWFLYILPCANYFPEDTL